MSNRDPHRGCTAECIYATSPVEDCDCPDCNGASHGAGRNRSEYVSTPATQAAAWSRITAPTDDDPF